MSGTIGARGGNGVGVAGVNWNVTIISAKFLGPDGGSTAHAVEALDYVTDLETRHGLNIVATNNSWGGGGYSQALHQAIVNATTTYPSNYRTTVSAGSVSAAVSSVTHGQQEPHTTALSREPLAFGCGSSAAAPWEAAYRRWFLE